MSYCVKCGSDPCRRGLESKPAAPAPVKGGHIEELSKLLKESGATVTFDPYRDNTKGCGDHCRGWNLERGAFCANHTGAIFRGDYYVRGGLIDEVLSTLRARVPKETETVVDKAEYERIKEEAWKYRELCK
jgi:hypothetical protein